MTIDAATPLRAGSGSQVGRPLDFMIIGTQKGGTTSLWWYLRLHPSLAMPELKEEPFFCTPEALRPGALSAYMDSHFAAPPPDALLGKATPRYMRGSEEADVKEIANRIQAAIPDVLLIALLRDPIERAVSHYRMSMRRGFEQRTFETAVAELLDPAQLRAGRLQPTETNSYLTQGEYGRILRIYRARFPVAQLLVEFSEDLLEDPGAVIDRVLGFLGLPGGYRPSSLGIRYHRGGSRRLLDEESQTFLFEFMEEHVWPGLGNDAERVKRLFAGFYEIWNVDPDPEPLPLSASTRARLEAHYEKDAEVMAELGLAAPWLKSWAEGRSEHG